MLRLYSFHSQNESFTDQTQRTGRDGLGVKIRMSVQSYRADSRKRNFPITTKRSESVNHLEPKTLVKEIVAKTLLREVLLEGAELPRLELLMLKSLIV